MTPSPYTPNSMGSVDLEVTLHSDLSTNENSSNFEAMMQTDEESSDELFVISAYTDFSKLGKLNLILSF